VIKLVGQSQSGILSGLVVAQHFAQVLPAAQAHFDVALDASAVSFLFSAAQRLRQLLQPALGRGRVLEHAAHLALAQPFRKQHDGCTLGAPNLPALPIGGHRFAVGQDHGRKLQIGFIDQHPLAGRGQARDVVQFCPVDELLVAARDIAFVEDDGQARHVAL
jgi:hypothetical protein